MDENMSEPTVARGGGAGSRRIRLILTSTAMLVVLASLAILGILEERRSPSSVPAGLGGGLVVVQTARPTPRTETIAMAERAVVVPTPEVPVNPKSAGWVRQISVRQGQRVGVGQTVAVLELADESTREALEAYQAAEQNLAAATAALENAEGRLAAGWASMETEQAVLKEARANLNTAQNAEMQARNSAESASQTLRQRNAAVQRAQSLFRQGAVSQEELRQAQAAQSQASARVEETGAALERARVEAESAEERVETLEESLERTRESVRRARASVEEARGNVERRQEVVEQTQAELRRARRGRQLVSLSAPVRGTVTDVRARLGELVTPAKAVTNIRPAGISVVAFGASDEEAGNIKVGMPVEVRMPRNGGVRKAQVGAVVPTVNGGDERNRVYIEANDPSGILKPGMEVTVHMPARKVVGLSVPRQAVTSRDGGTVVMVVADGKAHTRQVELGGYVDGTAIITGGISANDTVIVRSEGLLPEGAQVILAQTEPRQWPR